MARKVVGLDIGTTAVRAAEVAERTKLAASAGDDVDPEAAGLVAQRLVRRQRGVVGAGFLVLLALLGLGDVLEWDRPGQLHQPADQRGHAGLGHSFIVRNHDEGAQLGQYASPSVGAACLMG